MERYIVEANFHVVVQRDGTAGETVEFRRSQVISAADIPEGFDPERWIADGLIRQVNTEG